MSGPDFVMRGLARDGVDWTTVTDEELVRRCAGRCAMHLRRLRSELLRAFDDAPARWPAVFFDQPPERLASGVRALLVAVHRTLGADDEARRALGSHLSFLHDFVVLLLAADAGAGAHGWTEAELRARLRTVDHAALVRCYDRYRCGSPDPRERHVSLRTLCLQVRLLTLLFRDALGAIPCAVECADFGLSSKRKRADDDGDAAAASDRAVRRGSGA